eukprot:TRINITY_DN5526_c0_g1_i1.p1 TRINITY_DN5526_c0_g1~~TRINITY_DN5526_c0_g1_i1.p1  ORF type:complete len:1222 (+),score=209.01 TRINITY_DN5526_c0_g1_i1:274-3666(+)
MPAGGGRPGWTATFRAVGASVAGRYVLGCTAGDLEGETPAFTVQSHAPVLGSAELIAVTAAAALTAAVEGQFAVQPAVRLDCSARASEAAARLRRWQRPLPFDPPVPPSALDRAWQQIAADVRAALQGDGGDEPRDACLEAAAAAALRAQEIACQAKLRRANERAASAEAVLTPGLAGAASSSPAALACDLLVSLRRLFGDALSTAGHAVGGARWSLAPDGSASCSGGTVAELPGALCGGGAAVAPAALNVEVDAPIIVLRGAGLRLPGATVRLRCHTLVVPTQGWDLDTSGAGPVPDYRGAAAAASGIQPGESGADGADGGAGGDAGHVTVSALRVAGGALRVRAQGGRGGAGQNGGDGAPGQPGAQGQDGGAGGAGGNGGAPGRPGAGGRILLQLAETPPVPPELHSAPGAAPPAAQGGAGGLGGAGGAGVRKARYSAGSLYAAALRTVLGVGSLLKGSRHNFKLTQGAAGQRGPQGAVGRPGEAPARGKPNLAISASVNPLRLWGLVLPPTILGAALSMAEELYQRGDSAAADAFLSLVAEAAGLQARAGRSAQGLGRRARLLRAQLRSGFDYWGLSPGQVPLEGVDQLRRRCGEAVEAFAAAQQGRRNAARLAAQRRGACRQQRDLCDALHEVDCLQRRARQEAEESLRQAARELRRLSAEEVAAMTQLRAAAERLTDAVSTEAVRKSKAHFGEGDAQDAYVRLLGALATLVSLLPALPPLAAAAAAAALGSAGGPEVALVDRLLDAPAAACSVAAQLLQTAQGWYRPDAAAAARRTEEALAGVLSEAEADRSELPLQEVDRWAMAAGLQGAALRSRDAYLSAARLYQATRQRRGEAAQRCADLARRRDTLQDLCDRSARERGEAAAALLAAPPPPPHQELDAGCAAAQRRCCHALQLLRRAVLRAAPAAPPPPAPPPPHSAEEAAAVLAALDAVWTRWGAPPSGRQPFRDAAVPLADGATAALRERGVCTFAVDPAEAMLGGRAEHSLNSVELRLRFGGEGSTTGPGPFVASLQHTGRAASLRCPSGELRVFTHPPVTWAVGLHPKAQDRTAAAQGSSAQSECCGSVAVHSGVQLTPFAFWRLTVLSTAAGAAAGGLPGLVGATLIFGGSCTALDAGAAAAAQRQ